MSAPSAPGEATPGSRHLRRILPGSARAHDSLLRACEAWLELHGVPAAVLNQRPVRRKDGSWRTPGAPRGFSDLVACVPPHGRMLMLEVKSGRSRLRADQVAARYRWTRAGAMWAVVRSMDELPAILRDAQGDGHMHPAGAP